MDRNSAEKSWVSYSAIVALRKESVDRNKVPFRPASHLSVALRKESVDRNINFSGRAGQLISRSPQGERG